MNPASPGSCAERVKPASVDPPSSSSVRGSNYTNTGQSNLFHTATGWHHNSSHGTEHTHILLLYSLIISFTISSLTYWDSFKTETIYRGWCHGYHTVLDTRVYFVAAHSQKSLVTSILLSRLSKGDNEHDSGDDFAQSSSSFHKSWEINEVLADWWNPLDPLSLIIAA